jgi:hypothetical protein
MFEWPRLNLKGRMYFLHLFQSTGMGTSFGTHRMLLHGGAGRYTAVGSFKYILDTFVLPKFGDLTLTDIDKVMVQSRLNSMVPRCSESTIGHVRRKMVEVLEEAVEQEFINRNPASRTNMPAGAREPEQPVLIVEQLIGIIDKLTDARDKAIFLVGTFCAMRTSEIFGLPWSNFHEGDEEGQSYYMVDQIAYRGKRYSRQSSSGRRKVPNTSRCTYLPIHQ